MSGPTPGAGQVRVGMAWHVKEYQHEQTTQERLTYRDEEDAVKAGKRGLRKEAKPVPPWEWQRRAVSEAQPQ